MAVRPEDRPLLGQHLVVPGTGVAAVHASRLLQSLGATTTLDGPEQPTPANDWARSGAMALTGRRDGPPLLSPGSPASALRGALLALDALLGPGEHAVNPQLLGERAAAARLHRQGPVSVGGGMRFLGCLDGGWLGLSLARVDDLALVPALVEEPVTRGHWEHVAAWAAQQPATSAADRAALLGLAAAAVPDAPFQRADEQTWHRGPLWVTALAGGAQQVRERPLVLDLTSLWAGPLCAQLLALRGARVVKVESPGRPDGARRGPAAFYDLLHEGTESVALDLTSQNGVAQLRQLMTAADLVLEASRPRALQQLGLEAWEVSQSGTSWLSITAYGRNGPWAQRAGYGDDVAAAAGMVVREPDRQPLPCGDAVADPLSGAHAAVAAAAALRAPHAQLMDLSMRDVAADAAELPSEPCEVHTLHGTTTVTDRWGTAVVAQPRARIARLPAPVLGRDTDRVLKELLR